MEAIQPLKNIVFGGMRLKHSNQARMLESPLYLQLDLTLPNYFPAAPELSF